MVKPNKKDFFAALDEKTISPNAKEEVQEITKRTKNLLPQFFSLHKQFSQAVRELKNISQVQSFLSKNPQKMKPLSRSKLHKYYKVAKGDILISVRWNTKQGGYRLFYIFSEEI